MGSHEYLLCRRNLLRHKRDMEEPTPLELAHTISSKKHSYMCNTQRGASAPLFFAITIIESRPFHRDIRCRLYASKAPFPDINISNLRKHKIEYLPLQCHALHRMVYLAVHKLTWPKIFKLFSYCPCRLFRIYPVRLITQCPDNRRGCGME